MTLVTMGHASFLQASPSLGYQYDYEGPLNFNSQRKEKDDPRKKNSGNLAPKLVYSANLQVAQLAHLLLLILGGALTSSRAVASDLVVRYHTEPDSPPIR